MGVCRVSRKMVLGPWRRELRKLTSESVRGSGKVNREGGRL